MFEHSLYEMETPAEPTVEGDLFHNYEITNWNLGPRIYKILGISAVGNILALLIVGQTSLLTMKGCESPLVGNVCQVIDAIYVGTKLFGTDREYVDAVYEKTELGDAEVTFVDVTGITPPLSYPEGYFQIANPVEYQALLDAQNNPLNMTSVDDFAGFPTNTSPPISSGGSLFDTPQNLPKKNPDVIDGQLPTFGDGGTVATTPPNRNNRRGNGGRVTTPSKTPKPNATPDEDDTAGVEKPSPSPSPTVVPTDPVNPDAVNTRPLTELSGYVNELIDKNLYRLDSQFSINAKAKLDKEGKIDQKSFKLVKAESADKTTIEVLQKAIAAIGDSGRLKILSDLSGKDLNLTLSQDTVNLSAMIESEMETEVRANSVKSSLDLAISVAKMTKAGEGADQNDKDDLLLLQNAKIEISGRKVMIKFFAPKEILLPMIQRKLAEQKTLPKPQNSTGAVKTGDNAANQ